MNNFQTEKRAVFNVACIFTEFKWIFREQTTVDFGVDAFVETSVNNYPSGKYIALQIKGGEKNFYRSKNNLTFYFSERHYAYWRSLNVPLLIIIQDPVSKTIYWEHFTNGKVEKTNKHWKINIPTKNVLNENAKKNIEVIVCKNENDPPPIAKQNLLVKPSDGDQILFRYCLSSTKQPELCCEIRIKNESIVINFHYKPSAKHWDNVKSKLTWDDSYYFTFENLEEFIQKKHSEYLIAKTKSPLAIIKKDLEHILMEGGMEKITEILFDDKNQKFDIPKYQQFIEAFEYYSKLKKGKYQPQTMGHMIVFKVKNEYYNMNTYEGKMAQLKNAIEERMYDEICITNETIWGEVFMDMDIQKSEFIAVVHKEWESYWEELYSKIKVALGRTDHLNKSKERSWRLLTTLMNLYDDTTNVIELAYKLDEDVLYPIAVIAMLNIEDEEACYSLYCELYFDNTDEWESVCVNDENWDKPIFHIQLDLL